MKKYFGTLSLCFVLSFCFSTFATEKRTDGLPGSEFADFSRLEGELSLGAQFGALLSTRSSADGSFAAGVDVDYRPYALFGFRTTLLQGFNSPKTTLFSLTPLVHTKISNFRPYAFGGPGIGILNLKSTKAKFIISGGVGADIDLIQHFAIGMLWTFHSIIDSADAHALTARLSYSF